MIELYQYIIEKFKISKDIKNNSEKDDINDKFISSIKNYLKNNYKVSLGEYPNTISVSGKNQDYILLNLDKGKRYLYRSIMSFIDKSYPVRKVCSSNNQSIYIYPNYEES